MPPAVGDILRIVCRMKFDNNDVQNVFHGKMTDANINTTDFLVHSTILGNMDNAYSELVATQPDILTYDTVQTYNLTQDYLVGETPWVSLTAGASTTTVPPQNAALVSFLTNTLRSQGRKFLPPFGVGAIGQDGTITTAVLTDMALFLAYFIGELTGVDTGLVFGNWSPEKQRFAQWTAGIARDLFATQRRRYRGSGT